MDHLITQRLTLRPVTPADHDAVHAMATDFEVVRHTGTWPWPADEAFTASRCQPSDTASDMRLVAVLGMGLVGMIGIKEDGDLGYMLARDHWGNGYATEMGHAVVGHSVSLGRWAQLKACVFSDNPGSGRVLEKLDFVEGPPCMGPCRARGGDFAIRTYTRTLPRA